MKRLLLATLVAIPFAVSANTAFKDCSMKAGKLEGKVELQKRARVSPVEAKAIALQGTTGGSIVNGGIETEDGCLVYSYHVKQANMKGQTEVLVDAGNGVILERENEGSFRTAMEKPIDKTKQLAGEAKEELTGKPSTNHAMTDK
jgi:uncharacterized membrane protein YkoI